MLRYEWIETGLLREFWQRSERWLWSRGVWIERTPQRSRPHRFRLPSDDSFARTSECSLRLPIGRITTPYGFSFAPEGWHPYVATLRAIETQGPMGYLDSPLAHFHSTFQPQDLGQAVAPDTSTNLGLRAIPHSWPMLRDLWMLDVARSRQLMAAARHDLRHTDSPHVGPFTIAEGADTYDRLLRVHASIREHGYAPRRFDGAQATGFDGYQLDGYFLEDDDRSRFVVLHGHHRLGAAACLGITHVEVSIRRRYIPVVRSADLPAIAARSGIALGSLETVFTHLIEGTGAAKRDTWGLV